MPVGSVFWGLLVQTLCTAAGVSLLKLHFTRHPPALTLTNVYAALTSPACWGAGLAYSLSLALFVVLLHRTALVQLVPIQVGFALIWSTCSGVFLFGEYLGSSKIIGMALLLGGAWFISR